MATNKALFHANRAERIDMNIQNILGQLKANKTKNGIPSHIHRPPNKVAVARRQNVNTSKPLGKVVGYCPNCMIEVGKAELGAPCTRCNEVLTSVETSFSHIVKKEWQHHAPWGDASIPGSLEEY